MRIVEITDDGDLRTDGGAFLDIHAVNRELDMLEDGNTRQADLIGEQTLKIDAMHSLLSDMAPHAFAHAAADVAEDFERRLAEFGIEV